MKALLNEAIDEGVLNSSILEIQANSPEALAREIRAAFNEEGISEKVVRNVRNLAEMLGNTNQALVIAPKIAEYERQLKMGRPKQEAALKAREVNLDYERAGVSGKQYNRVAAFFNANLQSPDKAMRAWKERPYEKMAKILMFVVLPSIAAWTMAHRNEEGAKEYEQIPRWRKDIAIRHNIYYTVSNRHKGVFAECRGRYQAICVNGLLKPN